MKRFLAILLICFMTVACGDGMVIKGIYRDTYGIFSEPEIKDECVVYKTVTGNIIWSILLIETIIIPVWLIGWDLYEPVGIKPECKNSLF
jgi:hypothetical protein